MKLGDYLKIAFCHHLSLRYGGGGEKYIINLANELAKRHEVSITSLPVLLDGKSKLNLQNHLKNVEYSEKYHATINADITYVTYNPLSWLNFTIKGKKVAGIHSEAFYKSPNLRYGKYPLIANLVNHFTSYFELRRFDAIHRLNSVYPVNHPRVYTIPNFVDSQVYKPIGLKDKNFSVAFASRQVWQKGWLLVKELQKKLSLKISGTLAEMLMPQFYSSAHVTIVPSLVDTFGLTIVESALCGTPVITSSLPSHKALNLPLIYANSVSENIKAINKIKELCDNGEYDKISKESREKAMCYDKQVVVSRIEKMFQEVVNN